MNRKDVKRKVYSDPALKENKQWTIYTTNEIYKKYKMTHLMGEHGLMELVNEALHMYITLFPHLEEIRKEAAEKELPLTAYMEFILEERMKNGS
ncbi:hypothetical protein B8V81_5066 [Paenibacillus pasadenensis]|uniref:Uncharacterized protein n=1 Tax=Paenibacillus pasadenensis TaxID=217090 RepID=A0A2N5MZL8_9BACL|nr:hypothetical protein [Paenibacillus pasadenensis]PLT43526.1 hypothetical protein B8V81_5066 [Paenibacillus pasadenensis]